MRSVTLITLSVLFAQSALGHAHLRSTPLATDVTFESPVPRVTDALKIPECGGIPRTNTPAVYLPGQTIKVEWEEFIDHPGHYVIDFSPANDANFQVLADNIPDVQGGIVFGDPTTYHQYNMKITLPTTECAACTLRMRQFMSDTNNFYYSCADIVISAAKTPPAPVPPPVPAPGGSVSQSSTSANNPTPGASFSACGMIASNHHDDGMPPGQMLMLISLLFLPILITQSMRLQAQRLRRRRF